MKLLREKVTPYCKLGLADPKWSDAELVNFMLAHPILINRPIVVTSLGAVLASEKVLGVLPKIRTSVALSKRMARWWKASGVAPYLGSADDKHYGKQRQ